VHCSHVIDTLMTFDLWDGVPPLDTVTEEKIATLGYAKQDVVRLKHTQAANQL